MNAFYCGDKKEYSCNSGATIYPFQQEIQQDIRTWRVHENNIDALATFRAQLLASEDLLALVAKYQLIWVTLRTPSLAKQPFLVRNNVIDLSGLAVKRAQELIDRDQARLINEEALFRIVRQLVLWVNGVGLETVWNGYGYRLTDENRAKQDLACKIVNLVDWALYHAAVSRFIGTPAYHDLIWSKEQYKSGELRTLAAKACEGNDIVLAHRVLAYIDRHDPERAEVGILARDMALMIARVRAETSATNINPPSAG